MSECKGCNSPFVIGDATLCPECATLVIDELKISGTVTHVPANHPPQVNSTKAVVGYADRDKANSLGFHGRKRKRRRRR